MSLQYTSQQKALARRSAMLLVDKFTSEGHDVSLKLGKNGLPVIEVHTPMPAEYTDICVFLSKDGKSNGR